MNELIELLKAEIEMAEFNYSLTKFEGSSDAEYFDGARTAYKNILQAIEGQFNVEDRTVELKAIMSQM